MIKLIHPNKIGFIIEHLSYNIYRVAFTENPHALASGDAIGGAYRRIKRRVKRAPVVAVKGYAEGVTISNDVPELGNII